MPSGRHRSPYVESNHRWPCPTGHAGSSTFPRRSAKATATTAARRPPRADRGRSARRPAGQAKVKATIPAPVPAAAQRATPGATAIGIRDARAPAPGIGTGKQGPKVEETAAPAADASARPTAIGPDAAGPGARAGPAAARGVAAYAAQAAERAQAKTAVSLPAALIDVA